MASGTENRMPMSRTMKTLNLCDIIALFVAVQMDTNTKIYWELGPLFPILLWYADDMSYVGQKSGGFTCYINILSISEYFSLN